KLQSAEGVIWGSIFVAVLSAALILYFVRPFGQYSVNSFLAAMVEMARVIFAPALFAVAAFLVMLVIEPTDVSNYALILVWWLALIASARLLIICGRVGYNSLDRTQIVQVAFGFSGAVLIWTLIGFIASKLAADPEIVSTLWLMSIPIALGLAAFFGQ